MCVVRQIYSRFPMATRWIPFDAVRLPWPRWLPLPSGSVWLPLAPSGSLGPPSGSLGPLAPPPLRDERKRGPRGQGGRARARAPTPPPPCPAPLAAWGQAGLAGSLRPKGRTPAPSRMRGLHPGGGEAVRRASGGGGRGPSRWGLPLLRLGTEHAGAGLGRGGQGGRAWALARN